MKTSTTAPAAITEHDEFPIAFGESVVHDVRPLGRDILVTAVAEYKGKRSLDVRRFYLDDTSETWRPTSKGIRVSLDMAPAFIEALGALVAAGVIK